MDREDDEIFYEVCVSDGDDRISSGSDFRTDVS